MSKWTNEEVLYLKNNYSTKLDKELSKNLNRSLKSISYIACKLKLKKDRDFYEKSRKQKNIEFKKEKLESLYFIEKKSIRGIAKFFGVGKTTIEHYFRKYQIKIRDHSSANKIRFSRENNWIKGLKKEKDERVNQLAKRIKAAYDKKRGERIKNIEEGYNMGIRDLLDHFYWNKNFTQKEIAKEIGISRAIVIQLMREYKIPKKPKFQYIASLKGKNHSMYGKNWEKLFGKQKALLRKKEVSERFRALIIQRLQGNQMPFLNTRIEKLMAQEMTKRGILFKSQFPIENTFVCDFAIPECKIAIECDGDYWHANPKTYSSEKLDIRQKDNIKRDRYKERLLTEKGWLLFRFFESEIKSNVSQCVDKIGRAIGLKEEELKKVKIPLDSL